MPYIAATINEAIAQTNARVGAGNPGGFLNFYITTFTNTWAPAFDPKKANERTVRNWAVQSKVVAAQTPNIGDAQQRQNVADIVCRVLYATQAAHAAGRITTAQRDTVLGAWNGSLGANP